MAPTARTWTWLITLYIRGPLQQSIHRTPISSIDDLKDRVHTQWKNLDQQIIHISADHGVTNWRLWFDWMVDTLSSCFDNLVHLLLSSVMSRVCSKNICAFCHCVSSVITVLWRKVNLANNFKNQNKMDIILCRNNKGLQIIQHCALSSFKEELITKGTGFIRPSHR